MGLSEAAVVGPSWSAGRLPRLWSSRRQGGSHRPISRTWAASLSWWTGLRMSRRTCSAFDNPKITDVNWWRACYNHPMFLLTRSSVRSMYYFPISTSIFCKLLHLTVLLANFIKCINRLVSTWTCMDIYVSKNWVYGNHVADGNNKPWNSYPLSFCYISTTSHNKKYKDSEQQPLRGEVVDTDVFLLFCIACSIASLLLESWK